MKDISVIIPVHTYDETVAICLETALNSVEECRKHYTDGNIKVNFVGPHDVIKQLSDLYDLTDYAMITNDGKTDFCSQINYAVSQIDTDYFSILEFDDMYAPFWFKTVAEYYHTNEDVSLFLPINVVFEEGNNIRSFNNEMVWAGDFSKEIGVIDFDSLENYYGFNLTGGVFNTSDFRKLGGFKPSIKVAFNHEHLLRLTHHKMKVYVIPKEGYKHRINRENSLSDIYEKELQKDEIKQWFDIAKSEYAYLKDREKKPVLVKEELK